MTGTTSADRRHHRERVLRALGVTPLGLRRRLASDHATPGAAAASHTCVLVLPQQCDARQRALLDRIMRVFGPGFARASRVVVTAGELAPPLPPADAYLAFGPAQARALDQCAPGEAEVLSLDPPAALFDAAGKRRLWEALRALLRRWSGTPVQAG